MKSLALTLMALLGVNAGCGDSGEDAAEATDPLPVSTVEVPAPLDVSTPYDPAVAAGELSDDVSNPLLPFPVGAHWTYEGDTDEGHERIEVVVEKDPRVVWGATVRVVRDTGFVDDVMAEETRDWFAQDAAGNVWYLGEDTHELEDGVPLSDAGSWEAGVDGALPGITMMASPAVGAAYRQEYLSGEAEDYASIVSLDETVTVPAGTFTGCVETRERSVVEPDLDELKYFCPNVGLTLEVDGENRVELVEYGGL